MMALQISLSKTSIEHQMKTKIAYLYLLRRCKIQRYGIWLMGDDIGSGSVTNSHLRSFSDHRRHTQQCKAASWQKSKQTQPESMSSPINYLAQPKTNVRLTRSKHLVTSKKSNLFSLYSD